MSNVSSLNLSQTFTNQPVSNLGKEKFASVAATLTFCVLGTVNNTLILLLTSQNKQLRTGAGLLISHLLGTYLFLSGFALPAFCFIVFLDPSTGQDGPGRFSIIVQFLYGTAIQAGNWTDACLAVNRIFAIWLPQQYKKLTLKPVMLTMIIGSWILGAVYNIPRVCGYGGVHKLTSIGTFTYVGDGSYKMLLQIVNGLLYIPYGVIGTSCIGILFRMVLLKFKRSADSFHQKESAAIRRRMAAAKMMLVSFIWCFACYAPTPIIIYLFPALGAKSPTLPLWLRALVAAQCAFNPLIFFSMSEDYRQALGNFWFRFCKEKNVVRPVAPPASSDPSIL